jgi:leucyl/phenylalanyl-tRNA--protein transferase
MPARRRSHSLSHRLSTDLVLRAYREGIFPMALEHGEIGWFSPDPRGVLPLERFHVPRRLSRVLRAHAFDIHINRDFERVMRECAARQDEDGTWISEEIIHCYVSLHRQGRAHSVEAWQGDTLAGGLYGVHLGGAFFGESMFHRVTDASKVALAALVERMRARGFALLDVQWVTPHLQQFGAVEIARSDYLQRLARALALDVAF